MARSDVSPTGVDVKLYSREMSGGEVETRVAGLFGDVR